MAGCVCVLLVDGVAVRDERSRHRSCFSGELGGGLVTPAGCSKGPAKSENREVQGWLLCMCCMYTYVCI